MKHFKLFFACALMSLLSLGQLWADTKTEGFETKATSTTYNGTVTVSSAESDCGIGWTIYYGTVSTNDKISGSKSAQMRYYSTSDNRGYVQSTTAIDGLSHVAFKARVSSTNIQMTVSYSADASSWTALATNETFSATGTGVDFEYDVPSGGKYIKIEIGDGSTKPSSGNIKFIVDDVVFTYTSAACETPSFSPAAGSYEGTQNVTISSTAGATIYYTTDGSTPTTSSSVYSAAIPVSANTTIKAYAVKSGLEDSDVAEAAYTITEGPDVVIDFTDNTEWAFPTSNTLDEGTFSDGTYTVKVKGEGTGKGYKFSSGKLLIGQNGAYLILPEFTNPIEKIVCPGVSGASGAVKWNVYDGETAVSTEATGCTSDVTFEIDPQEANKQYKIKLNSAHNLQISHVKIFFGVAPAVAKPTISGDENFVTSTTVTLACSTTGADIYYTTDGSDPKSGTIGTSFSLTETATVRAIAKLGSDWSAEATKTFTKVDALTTMDAIFAAATTAGSTATDKYITFNNWVVSAVSGNNAFVTDGTKGFIIYQSGHGFEVGDILSGTAACKVQLYKGSSEITSLTKTTDGLTVTPGGTAAVNTKTIDQLGAINTGAVVTIENVTYDGTNLSDGANTIKPYNKLFSFTMENGKEYNVTGVIDYYDALQIMPRSAADVEEVTAAGAPEAPTFTPAAGTYTSAQSVTLSCETDGATIYYTTNGDTPDDGSTPYTGAISVNEDMTIKAVAYKAGVPSAVATAAYVINLPLTTMDAIFAKATAVGGTATSVTVVFDNWVVSGVSTNGKNVYLTDGTKGLIIYDGGGSMGFSVGDILSGTVDCKVQLFNGASELTTLNSSSTGLTVTTGGVITPIVKTIDALSGVNTGAPIIVNNVQYNGTTLSDGVNTIKPYNVLFAYGSAFESGHSYNVTGIYVHYNTTKEIAPRSAADIEEVTLDDPELSYSPATLTIQQGDAWSAPTFNNPNGVTIASYASNNESVATVTDGGVIALAGGIGTATITAHFGGNATYAAADATYTITVNEAGVYSMSFDLTRASYDAAADEEVVWNSNVVTFTAQKGTGTKVTNYLAGNYSGTTLIAETRFYANNALSFVPQAGVTITKVEWMSTAKGYATKLAAETWTNATAVVDGTNDKLVIITPSAAGAFSVTALADAARATGITVYYTAESEKAKLAASISIADMNMTIGDADVLLSDVAATSNPNKKAISYAVTSGTAVTIEGTGAEAALHAAAEGSATITATIPDDLGNYTGATTTFTITVAAAATLESIAIDGTATELEYTEGQSFNPAGLTVMGHYSNGSDAEITSGIAWTFAPDPLTEGTTSVSVTATVETISSDAFVVNGLTVSGPAPVGDNYVKVTASQADWSGDYILVYEDGTDAYVWNGDYSDAASNYASATISSNTIAKPAAAAVITIAPASTSGKYTLQVNGDKYFKDNGSNSKLVFADAIADAAEVTISYETDWTKLLFSERCIRFNSASGQTRFRFYAADGQQAVQLYKKEVVTPTPDYTRTEMLGAGVLGTICVDHNVTSAEGATFYEVSGFNGSQLVLAEVAGELEAGVPYVFQATGNVLNLYYGATSVTEPVNTGALKGTFSATTIENTDPNWASIYYFANHALYSCSDLTSLNLPANRAYLVMSQVGGFSPMPGRRYITLDVNGQQTTTGVENLENGETPVKVIIDGQMFILRGEKMYNANGQLVK